MSRPAKLDSERIVTAAIALLNEGGLEQLSLRKLAAKLDVSAPSLARHVGNKARLLALMSMQLFSEAVAAVPQDLQGADWFRALAWSIWDTQQHTRDLAALIAIAPTVAERESSVARQLEDALARAGLEGEQGDIALAALQALVTGWTVFTQSGKAALLTRGCEPRERFAQTVNVLIRGLNL
ncbi:TetR family transcriptional regulator [Altericroceibacterium endophyticum]|uniref:TetR family transcriptional regulator n=1 Tax=Altericroceibacterium endophyticum TaxID=1808508 RepID=A0A6I4T2R1_9SPHN|nr:TetR family transcriptional regulator [Altericroceibacterium endophyticum]MXO65237.1 TetR family transcriptional regulator [Altericroceibacterium endophyticum]